MNTITLPDCRKYSYRLNFDTGCYEVQELPITTVKLPQILKVEPTQKKDRIRTEHLVRGRHGKWDKTILTGLATIEGCNNWFYGDHFVYGSKNFLLFRFELGNRELIVYYFNSYYPQNRTIRRRIIQEFIESH